MEFITTEKGRRKIIRNGYMYTYQKGLANMVTSWECVARRSGMCNAKIKLSENDEFLAETNEHTHPPNPIQCEVVKVKSGIKRLAENSIHPSQQILAEETAGISEGAAINLPSINTLRRNIRSIRQENDIPPLPINIGAILVIPQEYQTTVNREQFLVYDSGVGDIERILIFASPQAIQVLTESEYWYADGTFKVCPAVFYQLYTVQAQYGEKIFPCMFALLPNKTQGTYTRFFHEANNLVGGHQPREILTDFER